MRKGTHIPRATIISIPTAISSLLFMASSSDDGPFRERVFFSSCLRLCSVKAKALVRSGGIPRNRRLLGYGTRSRQGKHQGFCGVVRDVTSQMVMFLMNMAVENRHMLIRHEGLHRCGAVACRPVPLW